MIGTNSVRDCSENPFLCWQLVWKKKIVAQSPTSTYCVEGTPKKIVLTSTKQSQIKICLLTNFVTCNPNESRI
jgi:hypothetical protein